MESAFRALQLPCEPPLNRFVTDHLTTAHWFDISAARADLGYHLVVSTAEGLRRLSQKSRSTTGSVRSR